MSMDYECKQYILQAIEDLEDYIPLLEKQDSFNQTITTHSVQALKNIFTNYDYIN